MGGRGEFHGGDIEVFRGGGDRGFFWGGKVLRGKKPESRVQSPESRVQGPVQLLGYALVFSCSAINDLIQQYSPSLNSSVFMHENARISRNTVELSDRDHF